MRVELKVSGGAAFFPGLAKPLVLDTAELPPEDTAELRRLIETANFFAQPAQMGDAKPRPDAKTYALRIEDGEKSHYVTRSDPVSDAALAELLRFVRKRGTRRG